MIRARVGLIMAALTQAKRRCLSFRFPWSRTQPRALHDDLLIVVFLASFINQSNEEKNTTSLEVSWRSRRETNGLASAVCAWAGEAQRNRNIIIFMVIFTFRFALRASLFARMHVFLSPPPAGPLHVFQVEGNETEWQKKIQSDLTFCVRLPLIANEI